MLATKTDGHLSRSIYYDPLLRPIFEQEKDLVAGTLRYRRRTFDSGGRLTFESYPNSAVATSDGVSVLYDALGRVTKQSDATGALRSIGYLSSNRRTVTDGNSHVVTYAAQAFDVPGGSAVTSIVAPEGQTTQVVRDVFGHVQSLSQSGSYLGSPISATRSYVYDAHYRLCKTVDPESGETAMAFDAADNLVWKAVGQTNSPTACSAQSATPNGTVYSYDSRNRLLKVTPPSGDTVSYTYDADGREKTVNTPKSGLTYVYDGRGLLEQQTLVGGGQTFAVSSVFDVQGHLAQRKYPSTRVVLLSPDAWGNPTRLGTYATGISYHPDGSVANFTYGNGVSYTQTLDARLRPQTIRISGSTAGDMMDMQYGYDGVGNVLSIADSGARGDSRTMTYDGLNRLATGTSPFGSATFSYDPLNNLRSQQSTTGLSVVAIYNSTKNRFDGISGTYPRTFQYNLAGDITSDGVNQYGFDWLHRLQMSPEALAKHTRMMAIIGGLKPQQRRVQRLPCMTLMGNLLTD